MHQKDHDQAALRYGIVTVQYLYSSQLQHGGIFHAVIVDIAVQMPITGVGQLRTRFQLQIYIHYAVLMLMYFQKITEQ